MYLVGVLIFSNNFLFVALVFVCCLFSFVVIVVVVIVVVVVAISSIEFKCYQKDKRMHECAVFILQQIERDCAEVLVHECMGSVSRMSLSQILLFYQIQSIEFLGEFCMAKMIIRKFTRQFASNRFRW